MKLSSYQHDENEPARQSDMRLSGYLSHGGNFTPTGPTVSRMPPGIYGVSVGYREITFVPLTLDGGDELFDVPGTQADFLFKDVQSFWEKKGEYARLGLAHRRAYLLHGRTGTGKTSNAIMLAQRVVAAGGLALAPVSAEGFVKGLPALKACEPERPVIVLLEEFDSMLNSDETSLLSMLDGESSFGNVVVVATTNHLERLPARIRARPGRFDQVVEIDHLPKSVVQAYALRVLHRDKTLPRRDARTLARRVAQAMIPGMSLAHAKEIILSHRVFGEGVDAAAARLATQVVLNVDEDDDAPSSKTSDRPDDLLDGLGAD